MSIVPIITIPHKALRQKAVVVQDWSPEMQELMDTLMDTLRAARNPRGVGLAAPQINRDARMFATLVNNQPRTFINPRITQSSGKLSLGMDPEDPDLEGCLSIPKLYAPVPRHTWVKLEYEHPNKGVLETRNEIFDDFVARVIQHEYDHLEGILFLDHALEYDLPVLEGGDKLKPVPRAMIETLVHQSWNA